MIYVDSLKLQENSCCRIQMIHALTCVRGASCQGLWGGYRLPQTVYGRTSPTVGLWSCRILRAAPSGGGTRWLAACLDTKSIFNKSCEVDWVCVWLLLKDHFRFQLNRCPSKQSNTIHISLYLDWLHIWPSLWFCQKKALYHHLFF